MASHKVPVTIIYRKPGTLPPLFIAGSYSEPQWQPQEMASTLDKTGEYFFKAEIHAYPGSTHQYKFRAGLGDWWILDESVETVTDAGGNRNNVLHVPSAASTPEAARTTAVAANSASLLDRDDTPPEIRFPTEEVGSGVHAFSEQSDWLSGVDPFKKGEGSADEDLLDAGQDRVPLFAHECVTDIPRHEIRGDKQYSPGDRRVSSSGGLDNEPDDYDLNDPTLENFPSRIEQIGELIHSVEATMDEDETVVEGVPPSAVLGVPRRKTNDFVGEFLAGSPATGQAMPRPVKRLEVPRRSMGSMSSDVSSAVSLHSITEGVEEGEEDDDEVAVSSPVIRLPSPTSRPAASGKLPASSDDDEAVDLKGPPSPGLLTPERAASPARRDSEPRPAKLPPFDAYDERGGFDGNEDSDVRAVPGSPRIMVQDPQGDTAMISPVAAEFASRLDRDSGKASPQPEGASSGAIEEDSISDRRSGDTPTPEGTGEQQVAGPVNPRSVDTGGALLIQRKNIPKDRATSGDGSGPVQTTAPAQSTAMEASKNDNWLHTFFKTVVDWIVGLFGRLFGRGNSGRET